MGRRTALILIGTLLSGCELGEPVERQPVRERHGLREVESAQRAVDRQLIQQQRDMDAARREALRGSDD